jgi:uncharacterized membrane protein
MAQFKVILAAVLLTASLLLLFSKLFAPQPIEINVAQGDVVAESPQYYTLSEVLLFTISAFIIGSASLYLFYNSEIPKKVLRKRTAKEYSLVTNILKGDEKLAFEMLLAANGEMLQNKLVQSIGLSKVKVTRVLANLERKNLIIKERSGLTNKVKLVSEEKQ